MSATEWLDTRALAAELGVSSRTVEVWRLTGDGPAFVKIGRLCRYRRADVDAWLLSRTRRSTADCGQKGES
jgi:predicted DNA-binding transcriptional regulator AlpA